MATPPYHVRSALASSLYLLTSGFIKWHIYQHETFEVVRLCSGDPDKNKLTLLSRKISGVMHYCLNGKDGILKPGETVNIKPGIPHTFWCDEKDGIDLEILITVRGGPNPGFDGQFVRNFYGFLSSNALQGKKPNFFQAMAYMYDADVIIQDFPLNSGRVANLVLGAS